MAKKILFGNYKGGVGKTTSTYQIASVLSISQYKVLLIDLDPQSSLSEICFEAINEYIGDLSVEETLNHIIYSQAKKNLYSFNEKNDFRINDLSKAQLELILKKTWLSGTEYIIKNVRMGLDFIPNSLDSKCGGLDSICVDHLNDRIENLLIIRNFIENHNLNEKYDFIFFDCPPSDNIITRMAFLYCDYYIIPTIMDKLSSRGVKHYNKTIQKIYTKYCIDKGYADFFGREPKLLGVFETMRKGTTNTDRYRYVLSNELYLFNSVIKHLKSISESIGSPTNVFCQEYYSLTAEIIQRINKLERVR